MLETKKVLMCPPTHFRVEYSINPWMQGEKVDFVRASEQWIRLYEIIESFGVEIKTIKPEKDQPGMVFTANAGLVHKNKVILSNFKHSERKGEKQHFREWFAKNGYEVHELPDRMTFEGAGDCLIHENELIVGFGQRSDFIALDRAAEILGLDLIQLPLSNPSFYHLDTCLKVLGTHKGQKVGYYYPEAFGGAMPFGDSFSLFPIQLTDAMAFACNSIQIGNNVIIPAGTSSTRDYLKWYRYDIIEIEMGEFIKAGGAAHCLVLSI